RRRPCVSQHLGVSVADLRRLEDRPPFLVDPPSRLRLVTTKHERLRHEKRALTLTWTADLEHAHLSIHEPSRRLCLFPIALAVRVRTPEDGYTRGTRDELRQQL